jgi:hypothetical protein
VYKVHKTKSQIDIFLQISAAAHLYHNLVFQTLQQSLGRKLHLPVWPLWPEVQLQVWSFSPKLTLLFWLLRTELQPQVWSVQPELQLPVCLH